jgi:hypothetical protein
MNPASARPGPLLTLGTYPHSAAGTDATPIQWRVLHHTGTTAFLLSEYLLDNRPYHHTASLTTWQECDLRRWLNDTFFQQAFTPAEQARIRLTRCGDNGTGSPETDDRVFLLSVAEVTAFTVPGDGDRRRRTSATAYAAAPGAGKRGVYVYDKGVAQDYVAVNGVLHGCSWWWTRTQLQIEQGRSARAAFVGPRSHIKSYGRVDLTMYGVRPALNLDLSG